MSLSTHDQLVALAKQSARDAEQAIKELESQRKQALAVLRLLEPKRAKPTKTQWKPVVTAAEQVKTFVAQHGQDFPTGFTTGDLQRHPAWNGLTKEATRKGVQPLADQGVLRIDRIGYTRPDHRGKPSKVYAMAVAD